MRDRNARLVVFVLAFALYAATLYGGVGGRFNCGDAAKWQYIGSILGVPHPPGSPLYVLVSHAWGLVPLPFLGSAEPASLAIRINLLSALFGALATTCVFGIARRVGLRPRTATLAVLFFALSEAMWTFSTEAEVYAPLAFSCAFVIERALAWEATRKDTDLWLLFFAYATGFGFHYMMITLLPALAVFLLRTDPRLVTRPRHLAVAIACIAIGILPIVFLWYRLPDAPYSELAGPRSVRAFKRYLLARQYQGGMFKDSLRTLWFERLGWALSILGRQGGLVVMTLAPIGLVALRKRRGAVLLLGLATLFALVFLTGYRSGDELGDAVPVMVPLSVLAASATELVPRARALAFLAAIAGGALNFVALGKFAPIDNVTHDTDEIHGYVFDIPCILAGAEPNAVILSPFPDYGSRQIALYYRFVDPRFRDKHLTLAYVDATPEEYTWADKKWEPDPADARPIYLFRRDQTTPLAALGYTIEQRTFASLGACGREHPSAVFFRAVSAR
jgi:hypothetical protein